MNSIHLMPLDYYFFSPPSSTQCRISMLKRPVGSETNQVSRKKKIQKINVCIPVSLHPGAILAPVTPLSVSLQAVPQLLRAPRWLSASIWLFPNWCFIFHLSPLALALCLVHSHSEFNQKLSLFLRNVDVRVWSSCHLFIQLFWVISKNYFWFYNL